MSLIKSRNWTKKEDEDLLAVLENASNRQSEATWNQIAELMRQLNPHTRKTGKQCRQRWANQLDPKIKRNEIWSQEQNQKLFKLHTELGNKWSQICSHLPGRTDNCVKNHFYSTMRRGMRKINSYVENVKRKTILSKTFKNQVLNKILAICEGKNDDKYQFNKTAKSLGVSIKMHLVKLSLQLSDVDQENADFKQKIFQQISEFSRNCRKRKTRKSNDLTSQSLHNKNQINNQQENILENNRSQLKILKKRAQLQKVTQPHIQNVKVTQIKKQLIQNSKMILTQLSQKQKLSEIKEKTKKKNINKIQDELQKLSHLNQFAFYYPSFDQLSNIFNVNVLNNQSIEQQHKKSNHHQLGFLESLPEIRKQYSSKPKFGQGGVFIFPNAPTQNVYESNEAKQLEGNPFNQIIISQQMPQNFTFPFPTDNQFGIFSNYRNMDQSANIPFSSYDFCSASPGIMLNNTNTQQKFKQKFQSTMLGFSSTSSLKQQGADINFSRDSSFKLIKKSSIADSIKNSQEEHEK